VLDKAWFSCRRKPGLSATSRGASNRVRPADGTGLVLHIPALPGVETALDRTVEDIIAGRFAR